jgi:hypothetical protein
LATNVVEGKSLNQCTFHIHHPTPTQSKKGGKYILFNEQSSKSNNDIRMTMTMMETQTIVSKGILKVNTTTKET